MSKYVAYKEGDTKVANSHPSQVRTFRMLRAVWEQVYVDEGIIPEIISQDEMKRLIKLGEAQVTIWYHYTAFPPDPTEAEALIPELRTQAS